MAEKDAANDVQEDLLPGDPPADDGEDGAGTPPQKGAGEGEEGEDEDKDQVDEKSIPVRQSFIIARQRNTIQRLRSKQAADDGGAPPPASDGGDDEGELSPESNAAVERAIERRLGPIVEHLASTGDMGEMQSLIEKEPDAREYKNRILAYAKKWPGTPLEAIYHHLSFGEAARKGTETRSKADRAAAHSRGIGSQRPPVRKTGAASAQPTVAELEAMSPQEFDDYQRKVERGEISKQ